jgi:hypothetical protein
MKIVCLLSSTTLNQYSLKSKYDCKCIEEKIIIEAEKKKVYNLYVTFGYTIEQNVHIERRRMNIALVC